MSQPIENLRNLGPASGQWLRAVGITTIAELQRIGPALAYLRVKEKQPRASLNLLWALAAGVKQKDWRQLTVEEKRQLKRQCEID